MYDKTRRKKIFANFCWLCVNLTLNCCFFTAEIFFIRYTTAVDVWSIGCIFAELLGRRIYFQAQGPVQQLNLIIDLLGTPSLEEMRDCCEGAREHILRTPHRVRKNSQGKITVFNHHRLLK